MTIEELKSGDLLFIKDSSEFSNAIITTTSDYSHVGIYFDRMIFHATKKLGVVKQDLQLYMEEEDRTIFVYRYPLIDEKQVKERAESLLGLAYNDSFYPNGKSFYCSEYIAEILPIFDTIPMQFGDGTNEVSPFWKDYFEALHVPVPVNVEGTNPCQLSQSDKLDFLGRLVSPRELFRSWT